MAKVKTKLECSWIMHKLARLYMKIVGWKLSGAVPHDKKIIIIAAPHTSNWDLIYLLATAYSFGIKLNWVAKKSIFRFPFGGMMRALGGFELDRSKNGMVDSIVNVIKREERVRLMIAPAGTRKHTPHWRSGFYYIAKIAQIPMVCGFLDYKKKLSGFGPVLRVSDSLVADMDKIREFYRGVTARYPELGSRICLQDEI